MKGPRQRPRLRCQICGKLYDSNDVMPAEMVREGVEAVIRSENPEWTSGSYICLTDLSHYRTRYVQAVLETERGELSALEQDVLRSLQEHELLAENADEEYDQGTSFGQRMADRIASFGGSWGFIITFGVVIAAWIALNSVALFSDHFDPYPFILLNLMISRLAALQAPVIMMSQNRQEARDRVRAEHDFRVNLKAELEIRQLHAKLDLLLTRQWQQLLEIQEQQMELMEELVRSGERGRRLGNGGK